MNFRRPAALLAGLALFGLASCGAGEAANDPGPAPGADSKSVVSAKLAEIEDGQVVHGAGLKELKLGEPTLDDVPRWFFEPDVAGRPHELASLRGWRVDYRYVPEYPGYPAQPERSGIAFFVGGALRGIFTEGSDQAPLGLDRWSARWVDPGFDAIAATRPSEGRPPRAR